jgi:imidazole glycerol-phosphate synthase subunit HisH
MIVIIDYGVGNLGSMTNMFKKIGAEAVVSSDAVIIEKADGLILPGVGSFDQGMKNLEERGLISFLTDIVMNNKKPFLGICLGMQLLGKNSEEGNLPGLGWISCETRRFSFDKKTLSLKIPHMGWNTLQVCCSHPLLEGLEAGARFYFVHSYHVACTNESPVLALSNYGFPFVAALAVENVMGVQFHPEKSHKYGMRLLKNFAVMSSPVPGSP